MRISKITIENFRSIESAEIAPLAFNVLVGQNNHGKTNFFEALEWFYNGAGDLTKIAFMQDSNREVSVELEYSGIQAGIESVKNEKTKDSFRKFADGRDVVRVIRRKADDGKRSLWDDKAAAWSSKNFAGFDKAFNDCLPRLVYISTATQLSEVSKYGKKTPIGEMLSGVLTAIMEISPKYSEFRAKFGELFASDTSDVKAELDRLAGKVRTHLEQQFPECSAVAFSVLEPAFDELLKNFEISVNDGIETTAAEKGDGMQRALMLAIIKTYSDYRREKGDLGKRFLFLIDEAELHLHPTAQRQLKDALAKLAEDGDQVFINTHSSVLVKDDFRGQALWRVEKRDRATRVAAIDEGAKPEVIFELLGGSPADLLFPTNFLIVEGRSEYELLTRVIRRFYDDKPKIKVIFAGGDFERQKRSMDAINTAFIPLNQTPVYRDRLVVLCDRPGEQRQVHFQKFKTDNAHLGERLVVAPVDALEEAYPSPWEKTSDQVDRMQPRDKTELAENVGDSIAKDQFESGMKHLHRALTAAWEHAYQ